MCCFVPAAPSACVVGQKALLLGSGGRDLGMHSRGSAPPLISQGGMSGRRGFPSFLKVVGPRK